MEPCLYCIWLNTCQLMDSCKWIPYFNLLACTTFALLIELSLSQTRTFYPVDSLPEFPVGEWMSSCVVLSCLPGLTHNRWQQFEGAFKTEKRKCHIYFQERIEGRSGEWNYNHLHLITLEDFEANSAVSHLHLHTEGDWELPACIYQSCCSSLMVFTGEKSGCVGEGRAMYVNYFDFSNILTASHNIFAAKSPEVRQEL